MFFQTWEYAIPDNDLQTASDLLAEHGFPFVAPNPLCVSTYGDFVGKGRQHGVVYETLKKPLIEPLLQLVPLSITCISLNSLRHTSSGGHPGPNIYRLPLPEHCLSLIKCISSYPLDSSSRNNPLLELSVLNAQAIFEYRYYYKDWYEPEESEEEYQEKIQFALKKVRSWILPESMDYWRKLLETVVDGSRHPDNIPYMPNIQSLEGHSLEEQSSGEQPSGEQSSWEQPSWEQPSGEQSLGEQSLYDGDKEQFSLEN